MNSTLKYNFCIKWANFHKSKQIDRITLKREGNTIKKAKYGSHW